MSSLRSHKMRTRYSIATFITITFFLCAYIVLAFFLFTFDFENNLSAIKFINEYNFVTVDYHIYGYNTIFQCIAVICFIVVANYFSYWSVLCYRKPMLFRVAMAIVSLLIASIILYFSYINLIAPVLIRSRFSLMEDPCFLWTCALTVYILHWIGLFLFSYLESSGILFTFLYIFIPLSILGIILLAILFFFFGASCVAEKILPNLPVNSSNNTPSQSPVEGMSCYDYTVNGFYNSVYTSDNSSFYDENGSFVGNSHDSGKTLETPYGTSYDLQENIYK